MAHSSQLVASDSPDFSHEAQHHRICLLQLVRSVELWLHASPLHHTHSSANLNGQAFLRWQLAWGHLLEYLGTARSTGTCVASVRPVVYDGRCHVRSTGPWHRFALTWMLSTGLPLQHNEPALPESSQRITHSGQQDIITALWLQVAYCWWQHIRQVRELAGASARRSSEAMAE